MANEKRELTDDERKQVIKEHYANKAKKQSSKPNAKLLKALERIQHRGVC